MTRIALCFDGTWNTADNKDGDRDAATNVRKLWSLIAVGGAASQATPTGDVARGAGQVAWYHAGVGTSGSWFDRATGGIAGAGLDDNIALGYRFLAETWQAGDEILLFGFSRGAYTARSLGGMIRKCGLLRPDRLDRVGAAMELYRKRDASADSPEAVAFRADHAREVGIAAIGVWDTVGALGIPLKYLGKLDDYRYAFHDTKLSKIVRRAWHAVAIDENREDFQPTLWDDTQTPGQEVEQRWFAGAHANVGGGYADHALSDLALAWMAGRAADAGLALTIPTAPADQLYRGAIRDSYKEFLGFFSFFYRWFHSRYYRKATLSSGSNETIDRSALLRVRDAAMRYAPKPLMPYLPYLEQFARA